MKILTPAPRGKGIPHICAQAYPVSSYAERYVIARFDVSPSLARTIVALAMIGGR